MKIHDLQPPEGSNRGSKRVARGIGGKGGKTAGRGSKGQRARNTVRVGFEGGQNPLHLRLPKLRGFNNPFRVEYQAVNLDTIAETGMTEVSPSSLHEKGLVRKNSLVKILGRGEISTKLTFLLTPSQNRLRKVLLLQVELSLYYQNLGAKAGHLLRGMH